MNLILVRFVQVLLAFSTLVFGTKFTKAQETKQIISGQFVGSKGDKVVGIPNILIYTKIALAKNEKKIPASAKLKRKPDVLTVNPNAFDRKWYIRRKGDDFIIKNFGPFTLDLALLGENEYDEWFWLPSGKIYGFQLDRVQHRPLTITCLQGSAVDLDCYLMVLNPHEIHAISDKDGRFQLTGDFPDSCKLHSMHYIFPLDFEKNDSIAFAGDGMVIDTKDKNVIKLGEIQIKNAKEIIEQSD